MRILALLLCLLATLARAQQSETTDDAGFEPYPAPPPLVPADAPTAPPPARPSVTRPLPPAPPPAPASSAARPRERRHSRFHAGEGGSTLILTQWLAGAASGAMLGAAGDGPDRDGNSDALTGAMMGGLTLGAASALYQYFVPVEHNESLLAAGAASTGFMAGLTLAAEYDLGDRDRALLTLATTQAGVISVLALSSGEGDVSAGDAALVGMSSVYTFVFTGLIEYLHAKNANTTMRATPLLLAPAVGMALGGLLALPFEPELSEVVAIGGFPLTMGLLTLWIGPNLADGPTVARVTLAAVATTLGLAILATAISDDHASGSGRTASADTIQALPIPVLTSAGARGEAIAAGPGLLMRF
ncbi:hypothetical protein P2318_20220 [Myxococcaceae bacterium GXIMD 01537]